MSNSDETLKELNSEFDRSTDFWRRINAEKRTNLNLFLGHHFMKQTESLNRRLEKRGLDKSSRIRVTKNHTYRICEYIKNAILTANADHDVFPENDDELQDQKAAEMHRAVLSKWKHATKYKDLKRVLAGDYVVDGEVATKLSWNPNKGKILRKEIIADEMGQPAGERVIKTGEAEIERIYGWDLIYPEYIKEKNNSPWIGYQKMIPTKRLKENVPPEIADRIIDSPDRTFEIFDPTTGSYTNKKGMTLVREKYTYPCKKHQTGLVQIFNEDVMIYQAPIPEGHPFPIKVKGFTDVPTSPRSVSIIRQLRPLQVNVNFRASQQVLTQMTLGQDKLIMLGGSSLQHTGSHHGVEKFVTNSMQSPTVLAGRSGSQFVESMNSDIEEMYQLANVPNIDAEKAVKTDPLGSLYNSIKDKRRFTLEADRFTEYMQELIEGVLQLKKLYMDESEVVKVVGRSEQVNIAEYKNSEDIGYQIRVSEVDENETQIIGKHLELTSMMQYGQVNEETTAIIGRNMPFLNKEAIFDEQLIDYDSAVDMILALDRGEEPFITANDNANYLLRKLVHRTRKSDFRFLSPEIQEMYNKTIQAYQQVEAQQIQQLKIQQSQLLPTSGAEVPLPLYETVPTADGSSTKTVRKYVPQDALEQFVAMLEAQGVVTSGVQKLEQSTQANIAQVLNMSDSQNLA